MLRGQESNRLYFTSYAFRPIPNHHQKLPTNRQFRTRSYTMLHNNYTTIQSHRGPERADTSRKKRTTVIHIFIYLSTYSITQNYTVLNYSRTGKEQTADK
jgi:hypothetical protein